jgi:hypothetical protein
MNSRQALLLAALLILAPAWTDAKPKPQTHVTTTEKARVHRSAAVRRSFMRQTGYPHGRPGYVIDHIIPLACGGPDAVWNLQWQTVAEAKAKDKVERKGC